MAAWTDTRVQPHVRAAAQEIAQTFGVQNIGGYSYRNIEGTNTLSDHAKGLALDVMTSVKGTQVANWAVQNASRLGITYVIWSRAIWDSRNNKGWTRYTGPNPHTDHVHLSFHPTAGTGGTGNVQGFGGVIGGQGDAAQGCMKVLLQLVGM